MNQAEEWRDIPGYVGRYQVSDLGRIRSVARVVTSGHPNRKRFIDERIMKKHRTQGYEGITLRTDGGRKTEWVHNLVSRAFLGERDPGHVVNHKNFIRHDNRLENLEYCTARENLVHAQKYGRGNVRFSPETAERIRADREAGAYYKDLIEKYGACLETIKAVCNKKGVYGEYAKYTEQRNQ